MCMPQRRLRRRVNFELSRKFPRVEPVPPRLLALLLSKAGVSVLSGGTSAPVTTMDPGALRISAEPADGSENLPHPPYGDMRVTIEPVDHAAVGWVWSGVLKLQRREATITPVGEGAATEETISAPRGPIAEPGDAFHPGSYRQMSSRLKRLLTRRGAPSSKRGRR